MLASYHVGSDCDAHVSTFLRDQLSQTPASERHCLVQPVLLTWDVDQISSYVKYSGGRISSLYLFNISSCVWGPCFASYGKFSTKEDDFIRIEENFNGYARIETKPNTFSTQFLGTISVLPKPIFSPIALYKQAGPSVIVLMLEKASRLYLREVLPDFYSQMSSSKWTQFKDFRKVSTEPEHNSWATLFGTRLPEYFWVEEECRLALNNKASPQLLREYDNGKFVLSEFRKAGFGTALSRTVERSVSVCLGADVWDNIHPWLYVLDDSLNDGSERMPDCRLKLEHILDWNLQMLQRGEKQFVLSHLEMPSIGPNLALLPRYDALLARFVATAAAQGTTVIVVAPQGLSSPPCHAKLGFLAIHDGKQQMPSEHNEAFTVLDLHAWLVRIAAGESTSLTLNSNQFPAEVDDSPKNPVQRPVLQEEQDNDACLVYPVLEAHIPKPTPRDHYHVVMDPRGSRKIINVSRMPNYWGVLWGNSKVRVNGQEMSFDDIALGYDIIFDEMGLFKNRWQGIPWMQSPSDALMIADLIWRQRPELIIELGTLYGGSAVFYLQQMTWYSDDATVVTVDQRDEIHASMCHPIWKTGRIHFVKGRTDDEAVVAQVREHALAARSVMIVQDASHVYNDVVKDLLLYSPFVTAGQYFMVQDTTTDRRWGGKGPRAAAHHFVSSSAGADFRIDKTYERFILSVHPDGFLLRVK